MIRKWEYVGRLLKEPAKKAERVKLTALESMPAYDPAFGDDKLCACGHTYYRHFDSYENMYPVGCKYCICYLWTPKKGE